MRNKLYRLTVLGIEQTLKMKFFIILNILMLVAVLAFVNFGTAKQLFSNIIGSDPDEKTLNIMVIDETNKFIDFVSNSDIDNFEIVEYSDKGIEENKVLLEIKQDDLNIINVKITSNKYIENNNLLKIQNIINEIRSNIFSEKHGVSLSEIENLTSNVKIESVILTVNDTDYVKYEGVVTIIAFIMYMLFIFVAATISSSIGIEKISKTTEYMLTGISEKVYLWYNILQVNIVFIIQMILSGLYFILANIINSILIIKFLDGKVSGIGQMVNFSVDPILFKIIVITIIQTILCVLILSIIQAILTSKVNNMTDISNSSMLVIMIVVFVSFIAPNIINATEAVNIFIKIISCLPIVSIVMVPKLILLHQIGNVGIIIAIMLNVITLVILSIFGSKWFKKGLLDSGNSKKTDKRKKDEIYDMNKSKFKDTIFKISISMLMFLVVSNVLGLIGIFIKNTLDVSQNINSLIGIIIWVASILPSYLYLKSSYQTSRINENKTDIEKISIKEKINWILMGLFIVASIQFIMSALIKNSSNFDITELIGVDLTSIIGIALFAIHVSILPAIFEELLFRKTMLKILSKFGVIVSILITSFCFGLIHQNITQGVFAFFMGIVLAYVTIKTKSILPAIIIHFLNNFVAVVLTVATKLNNQIITSIVSISIIGVLVVSGIILFNNLLTNRKIFLIEETGVRTKNILNSIFSQYIVLITILIYIVITIYTQIVLF